jgi:polysaccharide export outer membrane protein
VSAIFGFVSGYSDREVSMKQLVLCIAAVLMWTASGAAQNGSVTSPASAGQGPPATQTANTPTFSERYPRYQMRAGDEFDLNFELTPELNQTITVQPDGYITLRQVGDVYVNGLTVPAVTERVTAAYGKILSDPKISLVLKDFEKPYFIADGQFDHPGKYDLRGDTTVTQAVAIAGGFTKDAKHSQVVLFRRVNDNWVEAHLLNVKQMENSRDLSEDLHLKPGDMIYVPKNKISKIQQFLPSYGMSLIPKGF